MPPAGNSVGRTNEITTVSKIRPGLTLPLRAFLDVSAGHLLHKVLENIETIHYACWLIVPMNGRDYLVFISNYTGSFEKYIDDFGSVLTLALGLEVIWSSLGAATPRRARGHALRPAFARGRTRRWP